MHTPDALLLNLFVILTINNLISMFVYEISLQTIKTPFVIKGIGFLTVIVTLAIGTVFLLELYLYLKDIFISISHTHHF